MSTSGSRRAVERQRLVDERVAHDDATRADAGARISAHLATLIDRLAGGRASTAVVALYWPIRGEPDVRTALADRAALALPVVVARDAPLEFHRWRPGDAMREGPFGIAEPVAGERVTPAIVVVPCVGFFEDASSAIFRLGYGGGFYDRTLATLAATTIGVAYDGARLEHLDCEPHDIALDFLVTPTRPF